MDRSADWLDQAEAGYHKDPAATGHGPRAAFTPATSRRLTDHARAISNLAEVRFLDRQAVLDDLRRAAAQARAQHPEIAKVLLFGSLVRGNWTADSDADLIVIVRKDFADLFERSRYHIHSPLIPTDTLVYSEQEFNRLAAETPGSFLEDALAFALEL